MKAWVNVPIKQKELETKSYLRVCNSILLSSLPGRKIKLVIHSQELLNTSRNYTMNVCELSHHSNVEWVNVDSLGARTQTYKLLSDNFSSRFTKWSRTLCTGYKHHYSSFNKIKGYSENESKFYPFCHKIFISRNKLVAFPSQRDGMLVSQARNLYTTGGCNIAMPQI